MFWQCWRIHHLCCYGVAGGSLTQNHAIIWLHKFSSNHHQCGDHASICSRGVWFPPFVLVNTCFQILFTNHVCTCLLLIFQAAKRWPLSLKLRIHLRYVTFSNYRYRMLCFKKDMKFYHTSVTGVCIIGLMKYFFCSHRYVYLLCWRVFNNGTLRVSESSSNVYPMCWPDYM